MSFQSALLREFSPVKLKLATVHKPPEKLVKANPAVREFSPEGWGPTERSYVKPQVLIEVEEESY